MNDAPAHLVAAPATPDDRANALRGLVLGTIGVVIFGLTLPATRIGVAELDPIFFGIGRAVVAASLAILIVSATRQPLPRRRDLPLLFATATCVVIGFPALATIAMQTAAAAHGGVILALLPLGTAVASVFVAGERPSIGFWICAIAGSLVVLIFAWLEGAGGAGFSTADLFLLAAVAFASCGYATGAVLSRRLGGWQVICWVVIISLPITIPIVWLFAGPINWAASTQAWLAFGYVAVFSQLFGFFAWYAGLAIGGIAKVGQLQLLQTFVTLAGAALLVGEPLSAVQIGFAVLVVLIVAAGRHMRVRQTHPAPRP